MRLAEIAEVSSAVATTRSRLAKRDLIAGLLRETPADEIEIATTYLAGGIRQRRTGVGWRSLADLPTPAEKSTVSVTEVDATLTRLGELSGAGSATTRRAELHDLLTRLSAAEQQHLVALITGNVRQGALDSVMLDAIAAAAEVPIAAVRRAAMFSAPTGPVAAAALLGGEAALAEFDLVLGRPVRPMLASAAPEMAAAVEKVGAGRFAVETKLDGIRIQVHKDGDEVVVFTRSLDEISERLPGVVELVRGLPAERLILDGEAMTLDDQGRPRPFQDTASTTATQSGADGVHPFFFDLLLEEDRSVLREPASIRLDRLDAVVPEGLRASRLITGDVEAALRFFSDAVERGQEGVVLKRLDAPYDAGRRGSAWVKVKPRHTLDLVVLAVEWGSGRRRGWLSNIHLGARDPGGGFVMLGKTFKGMTDEMLAWQTERFLALEAHREGHVVHLRPEQVVEIAFDGVQRSTRYPGGVALRFARVLRYRDDKSAGEADTLDDVRRLG